VRGRTAAPAGYILAGYALMLFCFTRGLWEVLGGRWLTAVFFVGSALVLLYAIAAFIGFRASWEDLSYPLRSWLAQKRERISSQRLAPVLVTQPPSIRRGNRRRLRSSFTLLVVANLVLMNPIAVSAASMAKMVPVLMYHRISTDQTVGDSDLISGRERNEPLRLNRKLR